MSFPRHPAATTWMFQSPTKPTKSPVHQSMKTVKTKNNNRKQISNNLQDYDAYEPDFMDLHKTNSSTLSSFSYDCETDLISFTDTFATEMSSRPPSATSFLSEEFATTKTSAFVKPEPTRLQPLQQQPSLCFNNSMVSSNSMVSINSTITGKQNSNNCGSVYVIVAGTSFSVPQDAFKKIKSLQWIPDHKGVLHLNISSPAIFEVILGHIVFETLPAYDTLSKAEYDEFEPLALALGLYDLIGHFGRSSDKRLLSNCNNTKNKKEATHGGKRHGSRKERPIVLNHEKESVTSAKLMAANGKCARFVASIKRNGTSKILRSRRIQATHEKLCASEHIN